MFDNCGSYSGVWGTLDVAPRGPKEIEIYCSFTVIFILK